MSNHRRPAQAPDKPVNPSNVESVATREAVARMIAEGSPPPVAKQRADDADRAEGGDSFATPRTERPPSPCRSTAAAAIQRLPLQPPTSSGPAHADDVPCPGNRAPTAGRSDAARRPTSRRSAEGPDSGGYLGP
jgi:hypothetical protein